MGYPNNMFEKIQGAFAKSANQENVNAKFNYKYPVCGSSLALLNTTDMKPITHHHEILLIANTSLANKQFTSIGENSRDKKLSAIEELEKACWNGILHEMFPEILGNLYPKCESFLWQVLSGKNFLYINIGASPVIADHDSSIDPYFFSMCVCEN